MTALTRLLLKCSEDSSHPSILFNQSKEFVRTCKHSFIGQIKYLITLQFNFLWLSVCQGPLPGRPHCPWVGAAAGGGSRGRGTMGTARPLACPDRNETLLLDPGAKEPQLLFSKFLKRCYQKERLWGRQAEDITRSRRSLGDPKCPVPERGDSLLLCLFPTHGIKLPDKCVT